jgi:hypothetical protein
VCAGLEWTRIAVTTAGMPGSATWSHAGKPGRKESVPVRLRGVVLFSAAFFYVSASIGARFSPVILMACVGGGKHVNLTVPIVDLL